MTVYFDVANERCFDASINLKRGLLPSEYMDFKAYEKRDADDTATATALQGQQT